MANYISVDGGTTNTRISLVKDRSIVETVKLSMGAKQKDLLAEKIKEAIEQLLAKHTMAPKDITRILASGMITSEFGLCPLEHLAAPVGIEDMHKGMKEIVLEDISEIPFVFMRGVKLNGNSLESTDMMRGEETELMGIMKRGDGECVYVLPGSHSKLIQTDADGRIVSFSTMLTGEMVAAISKNTILDNTIDLSVKEFDKEYLLKGYEYCDLLGINQALFKIRILKNIFNADSVQIYSFFLGVVLHDEIEQILKLGISKVIIGGQKQLKYAMQAILVTKFGQNVICVSDEDVDSATAMGQIAVFEV